MDKLFDRMMLAAGTVLMILLPFGFIVMIDHLIRWYFDVALFLLPFLLCGFFVLKLIMEATNEATKP